MRLIFCACFCLSFVLLLFAGCGGGEGIAEREIEKAAPRYIGPADRYDADVSGLSADRARSVRLTGYGVRPEPNLELQSLTLTFTDVGYLRNPIRITSIGSAAFSLQATDTALTTYLTSRLAQNPGPLPILTPQVTFLRDQVRIAGIAVVSGQNVPISTTGTLQQQGAQVLFLPQTITVENSARGELLRTAISRLQIPLVDLSRLTFEPQIQTLTLLPGVITIAGTGNPNKFLQDIQPR